MIGKVTRVEHNRDVYKRCSIAVIEVEFTEISELVQMGLIGFLGPDSYWMDGSSKGHNRLISVGPIVPAALSDCELAEVSQIIEKELARRATNKGDTPAARAEDATYES